MNTSNAQLKDDLSKAKINFENKVSEINENSNITITKLRKELKEHENASLKLKSDHETKISDLKSNHEKEIKSLSNTLETKLTILKLEKDQNEKVSYHSKFP